MGWFINFTKEDRVVSAFRYRYRELLKNVMRVVARLKVRLA